jgi:hypothetical protein
MVRIMLASEPSPVELLILGAGWTSTFLIPVLERKGITYAATTTDGRDGTIAFRYDPDSDDKGPYNRLPKARTVLITFPLKGNGQSIRLVTLYKSTHDGASANYIQLGATSIWNVPTWQDDDSPYDKTNLRAIAEDELMEHAGGVILNLAGLYGGARQPRNWVDRVVKSKELLKAKGSLHLIHGTDVARAIVAMHEKFTPGKRWLLCDLHTYDWWDLVESWASDALRALEREEPSSTDQAIKEARQKELLLWVGELMVEENVKALPRDTPLLGRVLDGRKFWATMGIWPTQGRVR